VNAKPVKFVQYKSLWLVWLVCSLLITACSDDVQYQQGQHYTIFDNAVDDVVLKDSELNSAHLLEFFTYGCQHCQALAPKLNEWAYANALIVKYVPVVWNDVTDLHARAFYLIKSKSTTVKQFTKLHQGLFKLVGDFSRTDSLDDQKINLLTWLQSQNIQPIDALNAFNKSVFEPQLAQSVLLAKRFKITGTPTLVVRNRYRINNKSVDSQKSLLAITKTLIERDIR